MTFLAHAQQAPQSSPAALRQAWRQRWRRVLTHTHTYSGQSDHGGTIMPPESYYRLAHWALAAGIDAIGMGSPYTPATSELQRRYDGAERDAYYNGQVPAQSLRRLDEVPAMLDELRRLAHDRCLFYLDNETPKGRYGHMWWLGYHPDLPPWHDYDQPFDRWMCQESLPGDDRDEPMPYERRPYAQIAALQRAHGALGIWAHPTSWWRDDEGRFITNLATEMPAHAAADGFLDGLVVMGYQPYRPAYQMLWFALLDRGYRVTAAAEMDCGLSSASTWQHSRVLLNHVDLGTQATDLPSLTAALAAGRVCASSGPLLAMEVDGQGMGAVIATGADMLHQVTITAWPQREGQVLAKIELVGRGGQVLWQRDDFTGGKVQLTLPGLDQRGYLVARAHGPATSGGAGVTGHARFDQYAVTSPIYLHPRGQGFARPLVTQVDLRLRSDSPWDGATVHFEDALGQVLETGRLCRAAGGAPRRARAPIPPSGRITLRRDDGQTLTQYLINANPRVQELQRYLYRGRFLRDHTDLAPGQVPVEAWQLDEFPKAMSQLTLNV
ncbi:MAG: hypothetical protein WD042_19730 [Phycisphaeraceae bacterium]